MFIVPHDAWYRVFMCNFRHILQLRKLPLTNIPPKNSHGLT